MRSNSLKGIRCEVCENQAFARFHEQPLCKRHYMQMYHNGKFLDRTIFEPNKWELFEDHAICVTYNKKGVANSIVKVDLDKVEELRQFKIYCRLNNGKRYACISIGGRKILLHRYLMGIHNNEYTLSTTIDHMNGDSLDNRMANLRICPQRDNMKNIHKEGKVTGVSHLRNGKWVARIMSNYRTLNLGTFDDKEGAIIARLKKEKELFGEFGPNRELYYLLDHPSPQLEGA